MANDINLARRPTHPRPYAYLVHTDWVGIVTLVPLPFPVMVKMMQTYVQPHTHTRTLLR